MLSLISVLAVLASAQDTYSARVLGLFPHTGKSHQMVFEPLLRRLAENGHHVTVVSFFPLKNPPGNYSDVSLEELAPPDIETLDLAYFEHSSNTVLKTLRLDRIVEQLNVFESLAHMALNVCSKIVKFVPLANALKMKYDVVLVENFNSDCMIGLAHVYALKAPMIALSSCPMMHWSADRIGAVDNPSYVPIVSGFFGSTMTFIQRLENTFLNFYYKLWFRYAIQLKEEAIIETHLGKQIPDLQELANNITLIMVNVFHSLNGVRPLLPGIVEVGGMHLNHSRKPEHVPAVSPNITFFV